MFFPLSLNPIENIKNRIMQTKNIYDLVINNKNNYSISVSNSLKKYGKNKISRIILNRTPLGSMMNTALNVSSGFEFLNKLKQSPYDSLFHLAAILILDNGKKLMFEKVETMSLKEVSGNPFQKGSESLEIQQLPNLSVSELINNTRRIMGDNKFFTYNASSNNCQSFLVKMMEANIPNYQQYVNFIKQNTEFVYKNSPNFRKFSNTMTTTGRVLGVLTGQGLQHENKPKNKWINFVKLYAKENNLSYKEAMIEAKNHYKK
jgi:hypothetical protein